MIKFHIITLFPEMFDSPFASSILKRAQDKGLIQIQIHNLRDFAEDKHKTVDDTPYGGGAGMVLKVDVMSRAIEHVRAGKARRVLMTPQGQPFDQNKASLLSELNEIILICGHYEGFDERIRDHLVDEEISIGDFVLSGGEIPAMAIIDSISRLIPGVLGHDESSAEESFSLKDENNNQLIEYPVYTRPAQYKDWPVPEILQSGNHTEIKKWRFNQAKARTREKRPDLLGPV